MTPMKRKRHTPEEIIRKLRTAEEAMASGRPVVGTAVGGLREVMPDGVAGAIVDPRDDAAIAAALARIAAEVNQSVENIGARRLYTVIERVFEELSFTAPDRAGDTVTVDAAFVEKHLGDLSRSADLSRYVL